MYKSHHTNRSLSRQLYYQLSDSGDIMGIGKVNYVWDQRRQHLILLLESNQMFSRDINPVVEEDRLILASPFVSGTDKPIRTHLINREIRDEIEDGILDIGFSEVKLKSGYSYSVASCTMVDPYLLKVILRYRSLKDNNYR
jgi:hypothetical protein